MWLYKVFFANGVSDCLFVWRYQFPLIDSFTVVNRQCDAVRRQQKLQQQQQWHIIRYIFFLFLSCLIFKSSNSKYVEIRLTNWRWQCRCCCCISYRTVLVWVWVCEQIDSLLSIKYSKHISNSSSSFTVATVRLNWYVMKKPREKDETQKTDVAKHFCPTTAAAAGDDDYKLSSAKLVVPSPRCCHPDLSPCPPIYRFIIRSSFNHSMLVSLTIGNLI